jgi:capsular exopolysaccharide synthesis family protein
VITVALLAGLIGYGFSMLQPTLYEANASLLLADPQETRIFGDERRRDSEEAARYVLKQSELLRSTPVLARASQMLGGQPSAGTIGSSLDVEASSDLDLLTISVTSSDPRLAARMADAVAQGYQQVVSEQVAADAQAAVEQLEAAKADLQARIDAANAALVVDPENLSLIAQQEAATEQLVELEARAEELTVNAALYGAGVELFEPASVPGDPFQPQPLENAAMAMVLGAIAAGAFAWWKASRSQVADSSDEPAAILDAPLLGEIPVFETPPVRGQTEPVPTPSQLGPVTAEAYHFVVSSLEYALAEMGASSLIITSAAPGDGKSVTTLNMAIAAGRDGRRVIVVDADERMRGLSSLIGHDNDRGLTDLAIEDVSLEEVLYPVETSDAGRLPFIPSGSRLEQPAGFFRTSAFRKAMLRIKEQADLVMVDSPPVLAVADTSAIAGQVDGIVLVVNRGTPLAHLEQVRERLAFVGTPLVGYVFNRADLRSTPYAYGYETPAKGDGRWGRARRGGAHAGVR